MLSTILARLLKRNPRPAARRRPSPARRPYRPLVDALEDRTLLSGISLLDPTGGAAGTPSTGDLTAKYMALPLSFEANQGQTDPSVQYLARGQGYGIFLTSSGAVLSLHNGAGAGNVLQLGLVGADPAASVAGLDQQAGTVNYYKGSSQDWQAGVPLFGRVEYQNVYNGVNLVYYGNQQQLEYDFVVAPGADAGQVRVQVTGADSLSLDGDGNLVLHTSGGDLVQHAPVLYQQGPDGRAAVSGSFVLYGNNQVGFQVGAYDHSLPLVIDPTLAYSSYLGGSVVDLGNAITIDAAGDAIVTGSTNSVNFPTTANAAFPSYQGGAGDTDAFVTKFNPKGNALVFSTYLGGSSPDSGNGVAVDSLGNIFVVGNTSSSAFPTTLGAFQQSIRGLSNAFAARLTAATGSLVYSTYLGGFSTDKALAVAVDSNSQAYITGATDSVNFPTTPGTIQPTFKGTGTLNDTFVTVVNSAGTKLIYSTYLGGSNDDQGFGIALDSANNAYITGVTSSNDFPVTAGAVQPKFGGNKDAFVAKINPTGTTLVYGTYLGGSGNDQGNAIALDPLNNAYVAGSTDSSASPTTAGYPVTPGAFQVGNAGKSDAFVSKLNTTGTALLFSTYLGGLNNETGTGLAVDQFGNAYVTGQTNSFNFPVTADKIQGAGGGQDAFVTELNSIGTKVIYSTYLGGPLDEGATAIATDSNGNVFLTGNTGGLFPTTTGSVQPNFAGLTDAFVTEISGLPFPKFHLVFGQQPTNTLVSAVIKPPVTVLIQDLSNQTVTSDNTDTVTISLGANPGNGVLGGTLTRQAVNGVVTFDNLTIDKAGNGYTLSAFSPVGYPGAVSNPFNIVKPVSLQFGQQPTDTKQGQTISPPITVNILDAAGNVVTADNTDKVTIAIGTNPGGGTLNGTLTVTAVNGVATFSDLSIDKPGRGYTLVASGASLKSDTSATFNVVSTVQVPTQLGFGQQPTNTPAGNIISPPVTVLVEDSTGATAINDNSTVVTITLGTNAGGGTLSGTLTRTAVNGVVTFDDLSIDKAGTGYTLKALATALTPATSNPFNVTTPVPTTHMAFRQQPTNTPAGQVISPPVTVIILDANNQIATSDNSLVTISIGNNPGGGTLRGTLTVRAVRGVATFSNLSIDKAGVGYTLVARDNNPTLPPVTSRPFTIIPGPFTHFGLVATPDIASSCDTITVVVSALDAFGGVNPTYNGTVHISSSDPLAVLPGDYTFVPSDAGVHTFTVNLQTVGNQSVAATDRNVPTLNGSTIVQVISANPFVNYAVAADAGGGPNVRVFDGQTHQLKFDFFAYDPRFTGGVRLAVGDVFHRGVEDIITGPGPGGGPDIKIFDGLTGDLRAEFFAFDPGFTGGVYVAAGDVNADGFADIIIGADAGGGPNITVYDGKTLANGGGPVALFNFFAYSQLFTGGVRVAAGDVNGDGFSDIICGAGPGGGPNVTVFNGKNQRLISTFFAYDPAFDAGVYVASIVPSTNPCDPAKVLVGPGVGGGAQVRVFDPLNNNALLVDFMAELPGSTSFAPDAVFGVSGARVSAVTIGGSGAPAIAVTFGNLHNPQVLTFDYFTQEQIDSFFAYDPLYTGGVFMGVGNR